MAEREKELARKLARSLAELIGWQSYDLYFDEQSFLWEHGTLVVQAPDEFSLERICAQFSKPIRAATERMFGGKVEVVFTVIGRPRRQTLLFAAEESEVGGEIPMWGSGQIGGKQKSGQKSGPVLGASAPAWLTLNHQPDRKPIASGQDTLAASGQDVLAASGQDVPGAAVADWSGRVPGERLDLIERRDKHDRHSPGAGVWPNMEANPERVAGSDQGAISQTLNPQTRAAQSIIGQPLVDQPLAVEPSTTLPITTQPITTQPEDTGTSAARQLALFAGFEVESNPLTPLETRATFPAGAAVFAPSHNYSSDNSSSHLNGESAELAGSVFSQRPAGRPGFSSPLSSLSSSEQARPRKPAALPGTRAAMSLATFEFGQANALARAATEQVISRPGEISPLMIYGGVGSGKSHLATGLGQHLRGCFRSFSVVQLSSEQFTSRFLEALNGSGLPNLRSKFREIDLLILEDIQFFSGKKATLQELQATIDTLIKNGKQLLITADRHPNDLGFLSPEIQTRIVSGLVIPLQAADREARAAICRNWCLQRGMKILDSLTEWLAEHITGDVRRLSGALYRIMAHQMSSGTLLQAAQAMDLLSDFVSASHTVCSLGQIQKVVCGVCGVDAAELNGSRRTKKVSGARMLAMFLARKHTQAALSEIGEFFGGRRHSTVIAAEKRIKNWMEKNTIIETSTSATNTREVIRKIESQLKAV